MLLKRGYGSSVAPFAPRLRSQTSVFTWFGEGHSRLVQAKWSVASVFAVKHNGFETFLFQDALLDAWMPGCLDAWMPGCQDAWMPGCLDAWMPGYQFILIQSKIHNPEIDDSLVKKYLTSLF